MEELGGEEKEDASVKKVLGESLFARRLSWSVSVFLSLPPPPSLLPCLFCSIPILLVFIFSVISAEVNSIAIWEAEVVGIADAVGDADVLVVLRCTQAAPSILAVGDDVFAPAPFLFFVVFL